VATGPCDWEVVFNDCCDCWDELDPGTQQRALTYATTVLWAATGKQFGACPQTVRPCGKYCGGSGTMGYIWNDGLFSPWTPYILNGQWRNCYCGCGSGSGPGCCSCEPDCQVYLPGPVASIAEVTQDGILVPASAYRVDDGKWLVRTDGECWPECQDYSVDAGLNVFNDNTMTVTYSRGEPVPQALLDAAGTLACEFAKACTGGPCRLPGRLSTIARQGVQLTFQNIDFLTANMFTGIPEVDQIIKAFNPYGLARPMRLYSPDLPVTRQTTTA
jgi:hypothetical protein